MRASAISQVAIALAATSSPALAQLTCQTSCVSSTSNGVAGNFHSGQPTMTPDGAWLVFLSGATDLVAPDTNGNVFDVVRKNRATGAMDIVMRNAAGAQPNADCFYPHVSDDGRYVSCLSDASNLVAGDTNGFADVFVRDLTSGAVQRATLRSSGAQLAGNIGAYDLSADGRHVAFTSDDPSLVPGDTNGFYDVFVRDLDLGITERVNLGPGGVQGNADSFLYVRISSDGRYVLFESQAGNLAPGDTNGTSDAYLRDRVLHTTTLISRTPSGQAGNSTTEWMWMTADARYITLVSYASDIVAGDLNLSGDVFFFDRITGLMELVSRDNSGAQGIGAPWNPVTSADGRYVAFVYGGIDYVPVDHNGYNSDIFVRDRLLGTTTIADVSSTGEQADISTDQPSMSADGSLLAYTTDADNLGAVDTNASNDVYLRDTSSPGPRAYCTPSTNSNGCSSVLSFTGAASASLPNGFVITASNLRNRVFVAFAYSTVGPQAAPFSGGLKCLEGPLRRLSAQSSGGSGAGVDCSGVAITDFNARIASSVDPLLIAGRYVWIQCFSRDPGSAPPQNISTSDALWFGIAP